MEQERIFSPQCPLQGVVLVKDSLEADGTFLIPYTLKEGLSSGYKVVLLCLANTVSNYLYMLRKLGTNLAACMKSRQVAAVEALSQPWLADVLTAKDAMRCVEEKLAEAVAGLQGGESELCVIFDSLSLLRELCGSEAQWRGFVHRCSSPGSFLQGAACVVMRVHADVDEASVWPAYLEHSAQVVLQVDALEAGQAMDITGQLTVVQRCLPPDVEQPSTQPILGQQATGGKARMQHTWLMNYKLAENGVRLTSRLVSRRPNR
ncbi:probable elongator complex protein 6 [Coccomyxa sp. Obi]|nr:probable elongator complex protein 6 [Coccomyxa sp. Obi]